MPGGVLFALRHVSQNTLIETCETTRGTA